MNFSVLLSLYHKENPVWFNRAMQSIWDEQTIKPNEIVLVQDGPLNSELYSVISDWKAKLDDVLTIVALAENVGLGAALNEGLKYCQYELVARMDTDDIAMPTRFEKQITFMRENPEIAASSAQIEEWDVNLEHKLDSRDLPLKPEDVYWFAKRRSPLSHPATIFRKKVILDVGGYPPLRKAQDCALWSLLLVKGYKLANLPDMLLKMRTGNELLSRRGLTYFKQELHLLKFQKSIGFLSNYEYLVNASLRGVLRLSPNFIKNIIYRVAR